MDKKNIASTFLLFTGIFLGSTVLFAELPAVNQEDDLKQKYHEAVTAKHQTLEAPLLTAPSWNDRLKSVVFGEAGPVYQMDHTPNLTLQAVGKRVLRIQYADSGKPAMLTWEFDQPVDGKNQWFQMDCTGPRVPGRLVLNVKSKAGAPDSRFPIYLDNSPEPQSVRFKLPDDEKFSEVVSLSLIFEPSEAKKAGTDFVILNFAPIPQDKNPLEEFPPSDPARFDQPLIAAVL